MIQIIAEENNKKLWGVRGYETYAERQADIENLRARGCNYFVCYRDTQAEYALQYTVCEWKTAENIRTAGGIGPHEPQYHSAYIAR